MRRTVHISGQIEPFFGTLDENVRLLEESLRVRTHLHDTRLTIEGEQDSVDQAVKIVEEYNHLTRHGRPLSAAEVKSLMRVATDEPHESPRGMFEHGRTRSFGKKQVTPKNASQRRYMEEIDGCERAADKASEPHHSGASCGGSRRAARFSARHAAAKNRSVHAAAVRRAL
jgi:phosphate starvation-inducible PhoH-like protein